MNIQKCQKIMPSSQIFVVGAVAGRLAQLQQCHYYLAQHAQKTDSIIYTGDVFVHGRAQQIIAEICAFRCWFMAKKPFVDGGRVLMLQGLGEEIFTKFFTLHLAENPLDVIQFAIDFGLNQAFIDFGIGLTDLLADLRAIKPENDDQLRQVLAQWTRALRHATRKITGFLDYFDHLSHCAFDEKRYLIVNSGLNPKQPLMMQGENCWLAGKNYHKMVGYNGFQTIIRGQDHWHNGVIAHEQFISLADGKTLYCAQLSADKPPQIIGF